MERVLKVNAPSVVAEIIDGEAVIMNLGSGQYFSTQNVGCDIWRGIELQQSRSALARMVLDAYDVDAHEAERAVDAFVDDLLARQLVVELDETEARSQPPLAMSGARAAFVAPVLNVYTDMEELLLLDPIHDVDEMGWPTPKVS